MTSLITLSRFDVALDQKAQIFVTGLAADQHMAPGSHIPGAKRGQRN